MSLYSLFSLKLKLCLDLHLFLAVNKVRKELSFTCYKSSDALGTRRGDVVCPHVLGTFHMLH